MQKDTSNLLNLRNLMKRDPSAYRDEFLQQSTHFQALLEIFKLKVTSDSKETKHFAELIDFLTHVAPNFPSESGELPNQLLTLVSNHYENLDPHLRKTIVQSLIMLTNRELVSRLRVLPVFFRLFRCNDKTLRKLLFSHIVNDIRRVNQKTHNHKLNTALQNFMFKMFQDESPQAAKKSLDVVVELWRRNVWRDDKTVNAIVTGCFSKHSNMKSGSLKFFLGVPDYDEDEDKEINVAAAMKEIHRQSAVMVATKRRKRRLRDKSRAVAKLRKHQRMKEMEEMGEELPSQTSGPPKHQAVDLVYDPQSFAERLFSALKSSTDPFETRLLMMNVIAKFIGVHKLLLFNFYPWLQKYMQPHQRHVTGILTYLAQASHDMLPPEVLEPCVKSLANNFVTDRSSPEIMSVGINAIREICSRCPAVMTRELLLDLAQYKKSKQKGVMMAARSLISVFRELNPDLLHRRDRGKEAAMALQSGDRAAPEFGAMQVAEDVPGAQLLIEDERQRRLEAAGEHGPEDVPMGDDSEDEEKKLPVGATRMFTNEDFKRIRQLQEEQRARGSKRKREDGSTLLDRSGEDVTTDDIVGYRKAEKLTSEERRANIKEERASREKWNGKEKKGGLTNTEKKRNQPFALVKHARNVRAKTTEKFTLKMKKAASHLKTMRKAGNRKKKQRRRL